MFLHFKMLEVDAILSLRSGDPHFTQFHGLNTQIYVHHQPNHKRIPAANVHAVLLFSLYTLNLVEALWNNIYLCLCFVVFAVELLVSGRYSFILCFVCVCVCIGSLMFKYCTSCLHMHQGLFAAVCCRFVICLQWLLYPLSS